MFVYKLERRTNTIIFNQNETIRSKKHDYIIFVISLNIYNWL